MSLRVVLDTNILISAGLKQDSFPGLAVRWMAQSGGLLKTTATENEFWSVIQRPRIAPKLHANFIYQLKTIFAAAEFVQVNEPVVACRDEKDDKFLELAVNGHADVLVSGDADLLALDTFRDIPILSPAAFCRALAL